MLEHENQCQVWFLGVVNYFEMVLLLGEKHDLWIGAFNAPIYFFFFRIDLQTTEHDWTTSL